MDDVFTSQEPVAEADSAYSLPHSLEAEQAVLGGLMIDNERFDAVAEIVSERDFFQQSHRGIYACMTRLAEQGQPLDIVTLSEKLQDLNELDAIGGHAYLADLADNTPSAANITAYAHIVRERSTLRQLISAAAEISRSSFNPAGLEAGELLQLAESKVARIAEDRPKTGGFQEVNDLLKGAVHKIDELFTSGSDITGLATGFTDLDKKTSGWQSADLIILAARPSMGKTALAMNFVEHAALHQDKPVLVFSMEMPAESLIIRMLAAVGRIDQGRMRNGKLTQEDWPKLQSAAARLKDRPLFIDDTPALTPQEMRARVKRIAREHGEPALIMLDYLQLMQTVGGGENRTLEISEISRSLKAIAKEYRCPIIALSQLSRAVEQRPNKRPMNSDLRESGAIEQDADLIIFIYRDEYYNEESQDKGTAEIIIGKHRNGETGVCRLAFIGHHARFDNLAMDYMGAE